MSRRKEGHFHYRPKRDKRLKSRTFHDRRQWGEDGWQQHWKTDDLRILSESISTDHGDWDTLYTVKLPKYIVTRGQALDYLSGVFYVSCNHTYDCCGCFFSSVWTHTFRRNKRKEYSIRVSYQRNV